MNDRNESPKAIAAAFLTSAFCWLLPTQAAASDVDAQKPQISIKKSYVKISLVIDTDLKPFAKLFANCLAEGKAWVDKTYGDATAEARDNRKAFRGLQWFYDREYTLRSIAGPYVSVVRGDQWFDGGAHPNQHIDTILWDDSARKRVSIRPFFTETTDDGSTTVTLAQLAKLAVASAKLAKDINGYDEDTPAAKDMTPEQELQHDTFINDGIKPSILGIGPVTLAPSSENGKSSGLTFHYSPYDVGPYVEGPYTVFVPWTKFRQYLSSEGMVIFGGERPKGDEENW